MIKEKRSKIFLTDSHHIKEWHFDKNVGLNPSELTTGLHKKVWWLCEKGHEWEAAIYSKKEKGCPYCSGRKTTREKSLSFTHPDIASQWHFTKNDKLTPFDVSFGSSKKVWWYCSKCKSDYCSIIANRTKQGTGCSYCANISKNHTNSLATVNPLLASEWHPTKNGELTPSDVVPKSAKHVWWLGECGHEWNARLEVRNLGSGCPICDNKRILIGFNDMWTTNPELASMLLNPEDGYKYTQSSNKKLDWKCNACNYINRNKRISDIRKVTNSCPSCSDGRSYPEKFMHNLLSVCKIDFEHQKSFSWSTGKRYDFYIPSLNMIIETHGRQHYYEWNFKGVIKRSLKEEQENDRLKKEYAIKNGINNYVVIDCRRSESAYIKKSITESYLNTFLPLEEVDWKIVIKNANKSVLPLITDFYNINKDILNYNEMRQVFGISMGTLKYYLKQGSKIGLCDYKPYGKKKSKHSLSKANASVVQLDLEGNFSAEWETATQALRGLNKKSLSCIVEACNGNQITAYGFKWMYKDEYEELNKVI